jgi:hypothetical protein
MFNGAVKDQDGRRNPRCTPASGPAYWAGGATLGPIIALAYRAAHQADQEQR